MLNDGLQNRLGWLPAAIALAVNLNVLWNGFVWDDNYIIREAAHSVLGPVVAQGVENTYYRPVVEWSWIADRAIWDKNPIGFHLTNLILHMGTTLLLTFVGLRLLRGYAEGSAVALVAATLFAVHPVHSEAVAWIAGRNDLFPAFFMTLAMGFYLQIRQGAPGVWRWPLWMISVLLSLLSKESALPLLVIFPLVDWAILKPGLPLWRYGLKPSGLFLGILALAYAGLRHVTLGSPVGEASVREMSSASGLLTVLRSLGFYIKQSLFPHPLNAFVLPASETNPADLFFVILAIAASTLLIGLTLRRSTRPVSLGLWTFFLGLGAPLLVPLVQVTHAPLAERYLYLPSLGLVFILAVFLIKGSSWIGGNREGLLSHLGPVLVVLAVSLYSAILFTRNQVWRNDLSLWEDTVVKSPHAAVPHNLLGLAYKHEGRWEDAKREFEMALRSKGGSDTLALAANNLGSAYYQDRQFDKAEKAFAAAIDHEPRLYLPYHNLGLVYWEKFRAASAMAGPPGGSETGQEMLDRAHQSLVQAIVRNPTYADSYYVLGLVDVVLKREDRARENFKKVLELAPDSAFAKDAGKRLSEGSRED